MMEGVGDGMDDTTGQGLVGCCSEGVVTAFASSPLQWSRLLEHMTLAASVWQNGIGDACASFWLLHQ